MNYLNNALEIIKKLNNHGFQAYIVGGYVRDRLCNLESYDIDITTNAQIKDIMSLFNVVDNGSDYDSVTIMMNNDSYEITTFRKELGYDDHRHPKVQYTSDFYEDLDRRDFTINALALDSNDNIIDKFNGLDDIKASLIRAIGNPFTKFDEDPLRILRGIYLVSKLGFTIEPKTLEAMKDKAYLIEGLSGIRKQTELTKIIKYNKNNSALKVLLDINCHEYIPGLYIIKNLIKNNIVINDIDIFYSLMFRDKLDKKFEFRKDYRKYLEKIISLSMNNIQKYDMINNDILLCVKANEVRRVLGLSYLNNIEDIYNSLPIKSVNDIEFRFDELPTILNKESGKWIGQYRTDIISKILDGKLKNGKDEIIKYIKEDIEMEDIEKLDLYAKVDQIMNSDNMVNLIVSQADSSEKINLKLEANRAEGIYVNCIYWFNIAKYRNTERNIGYVNEFKSVADLEDSSLQNEIYRQFMKSSPIDYKELKKGVESYVKKIDNKVLFDITNELLTKYNNDFYLYPAASKLHHAYVGGLAYHTLGMLNLVDGLAANYDYIDKNYMYAGIILHDIGKVIEFSGIENTEYTIEGQLLGHLLIGCNEIQEVANKLGYSNSEEVLILEHMVASHHGQPLFGAIKKPAVAEAALLWYIDTIDSKFRVLGEELNKTKPGEFTEAIGVMDRTKFYKRKK